MPGRRPREITFTKTCATCGGTFERRENESATNYRRRKTCSQDCRRAKESETKGQAHVFHLRACTMCGTSMPKARWESASQYLERKYCSRECMGDAQRGNKRASEAADRRGRAVRRDREAARRIAKRAERQKLANDGYVFNGRFPTPRGVTTWVPVSGPDTGVIVTAFAPSRATRCPTTLAALRSAMSAHPDLGAALLGHLTDSWVQQDAASYNG
jgi:hypothetical protein